ncbi:hypothetical protein Plhal304r1_c017g0062801 [Plasmopara halstedii]
MPEKIAASSSPNLSTTWHSPPDQCPLHATAEWTGCITQSLSLLCYLHHLTECL